VPSKSFSAPSQRALDFIEKVCFIEKSTGAELRFPEDMSFTRDDFQAAEKIVSVIENGYYQQYNIAFDIRLQKDGVTLLLEKYNENSSISFQTTADENSVDILLGQINLGPAIQKIKGNIIFRKEEAQRWSEQASNEDTFVVHLFDAELLEEFENWQKS